MELFVKLNRESGITIILVTHEPDIAAFSRRIVRFRDGRIVSDEPMKPPETGSSALRDAMKSSSVRQLETT